MSKEPPFDVVLDDQLQCTYVPRASKATKAAAVEQEQSRRFIERWTERGGTGRNDDSDADDDDDDIGDRFRDDGRYLANANRDVSRLLDTARLIYAQDDDAPDLPTGHKMVLLDRARRVAFGYVKPRPKTLAQGVDGGVNVSVYQRRRVRPGEDGALSLTKTPPARTTMRTTMRMTIAPRHRADMGTACAGVLPDQFSALRAPRAAAACQGSSVVSATKNKATTKSGDKNARLQRALAQYLLRQPAVTAVHAVLRHN